MKTRFWKHEFEILFVYPLFFAISFAIFLAGTILMFSSISFLPLMLVGLIFLILITCSILFNKRLLSKVIYSKEYIKQERLKKEIKRIYWNEIIDIDSIPVGRGHFYLSFVSNQQQISVELTKKMYKTILQLCPNINIVTKIKQMNEFKWLHKEDYKK